MRYEDLRNSFTEKLEGMHSFLLICDDPTDIINAAARSYVPTHTDELIDCAYSAPDLFRAEWVETLECGANMFDYIEGAIFDDLIMLGYEYLNAIKKAA